MSSRKGQKSSKEDGNSRLLNETMNQSLAPADAKIDHASNVGNSSKGSDVVDNIDNIDNIDPNASHISINASGAPGSGRLRALSDPTNKKGGDSMQNLMSQQAQQGQARMGYHAAFVRHDAYVAPIVPIIRELGPGLHHTNASAAMRNRRSVIQGAGGAASSGGGGGGGNIQSQQQAPVSSINYGGGGGDNDNNNMNYTNTMQYFDSNLVPRVVYDRNDFEDIMTDTVSIDGTDFLVENAKRGTLLDTALQSETRSQMIAIFMLCSISLGVGVFVLPKILLTTGVGTGILMIVVFGFFAAYTQYISIDCAIHYKSHSYESLASQSLGKLGEFLLAFFMAISLLTGNCSHISTVGQLLHDIIDWFWTNQYEKYRFSWSKNAILYGVMLSLTIPWLFQKNISGLSSVGTMSVLVVLITSISLVIVSLNGIIVHDDWAKPDSDISPIYGFDNLWKTHFWQKEFWQTAPTFGFVFTGLLELFPVFNELQNRNPKKAKNSIFISTLICAILYIVVSSIVVIRYGTRTEDNSLYNVKPDNYWITFLCFCLVIMITLLYPVINYPMVNAIEKILEFHPSCRIDDIVLKNHNNGMIKDNTLSVLTEEYGNDNDDITSLLREQIIKTELKKNSNWFVAWILYRRRAIISILGVFIVILVDIGVSNLPDLFGLTGSLGLSFVCYIFPCLIHLKTNWDNLKWYNWKFLTSMFLLIFFTFLMVYSTTVIIQNIIQGN